MLATQQALSLSARDIRRGGAKNGTGCARRVSALSLRQAPLKGACLNAISSLDKIRLNTKGGFCLHSLQRRLPPCLESDGLASLATLLDGFETTLNPRKDGRGCSEERLDPSVEEDELASC
uniref:Uncharacterized protein n=1 Tax=Haptolina brevifila TaxID=156173 RepID=A0A7S2JNT7_9EUKA